ncbi:Adenylate kinase isoenzyme 6 [Nymphon striatum]|nr:Adenylate kinase isoenzyme 6 [Nymphon striatum]
MRFEPGSFKSRIEILTTQPPRSRSLIDQIISTPGTGKSTISERICEKCKFESINISEIAKENDCLSGYDEQHQSSMLDEEKVVDMLEDRMKKGGKVVEYHSSDFFPEHWFDVVFVVRTNNTILYDRLKERGYSGKKLNDNIQCEIFQTILEETREAYEPEIIHELQNDTDGDLEKNIDNICKWVECWKNDNGLT